MSGSPASTPSPPGGGDVIVLAGGDPVDSAIRDLLPMPAFTIAADSGLAAAAVLDLDVDLIVGDLDSVDAAQLAAARAAGVEVDRHPVDKDATDLALAMDAALARGPARIVVVGGHGGRLDHLLTNAALLASPAYTDVEVIAHMGAARVTVVRAGDPARPWVLTGHEGELVSLVPMHGDARGVTTHGLRFGLTGQDLTAGSSQGVSNELTGSLATVALRAGVLLVVQPVDATPR